MVITTTIAYTYNYKHSLKWEYLYFISQAKTVKSANRNIYNYLRDSCDGFKYISSDVDISDFLYKKMSDISWNKVFAENTLPCTDKVTIIQITKEFYDKIIKN